LGARGEDLAMARAVAACRRLRRGGRAACTLRRRRVLCAHLVQVWATARGPAPHLLGRVRPSRPVPWLRLAGQVHAVHSWTALSFSPTAVWKYKILFYFISIPIQI
jgi:hypothetical protein